MNKITTTLVELALEEDLQDIGDLTSIYFVDENHRSTGRIVSREAAVVSGVEVAEFVFKKIDPELSFSIQAKNGSRLEKGDVICTISGATRSILTAERTALNFLQRLSGVATVAAQFSKRVAHTNAQMLDTRKTTPGWRALEKKAVADGGAMNHRMGLYDAIMVKDNHLAANLETVNLEKRISEVKAHSPDLKMEVEADLLDQVEAFLKITGIDVILLDNMSNDELVQAVAMRDEAASQIQLEASGGVNLETVKAIAETGVDFISVGAMTHSVRSIDLGLDLESHHE